jgi:Flp pilus assembly protein TadG
MIFALALVPLVLLIALSIDYSFYAEARSQIQLAADAAATHAVRAATGTYALETSAGIAVAQAETDAETAGNIAGAAWFQAQLGQLPTASVPVSGPSCTQAETTGTATSNPCVNTQSQTNPSGFTAAVGYQGLYPPFFGSLFNNKVSWDIAGNAGAAAQYSYVEIMMLLDTSQSMQIGADASDITALEDNTVCVPNAQLTDNEGLAGLGASYTPFNPTVAPYDGSATSDVKNLDFTSGNVAGYTPPAGYTAPLTTATPTLPSNANQGACNSDICKVANSCNQVPNGPASRENPKGAPMTPCALACHTTTATNGGYSTDLYGIARRLNATLPGGLHLRIDSVFAATENVLTTMIDSEQASKQYSVGVYQFNDDVSAIAQGTGTNPEASYDLPTVLAAIKKDDWQSTPFETNFPPLVNAADTSDYTNFANSISDFVSGTATGGTALKQVTVSTQGTTIDNPIKDVFIVTDGLGDISPAVGRQIGEMTSALDERVCQKLKNLNFTVYVLYINYYPISEYFYLTPTTNQPATTYTAYDYPTIANNKIIQGYVEGVAQGATTVSAVSPSPDVAAMTACASSPKDFYTATSTADINNQLAAILKSALSTGIRVTN